MIVSRRAIPELIRVLWVSQTDSLIQRFQDMSGVHREYDRVFFMVSLVACRKLPDFAQPADMDSEFLLGT